MEIYELTIDEIIARADMINHLHQHEDWIPEDFREEYRNCMTIMDWYFNRDDFGSLDDLIAD